MTGSIFWCRRTRRLWQVLPLGPTGYGDSPYQSFSTFAGNPYLISLEAIWPTRVCSTRMCWIARPAFRASLVDFGAIYNVEAAAAARMPPTSLHARQRPH
jgi:4-alpha-glucanotransferase